MNWEQITVASIDEPKLKGKIGELTGVENIQAKGVKILSSTESAKVGKRSSKLVLGQINKEKKL